MESKIVKSDFKRLEKFLKDLRGSSGFKVRVGIMGNKNYARNYKPGSSSMTNADIGVIHEFGRPKTKKSPAIPMRSFLRMPIRLRSNTIVKEVQQFITLKAKQKDPPTIVSILTQLGIACERAILEAFDTKGFGHWKANSPVTIRMKGSNMPLIDLGFLRRSITSEVAKA